MKNSLARVEEINYHVGTIQDQIQLARQLVLFTDAQAEVIRARQGLMAAMVKNNVLAIDQEHFRTFERALADRDRLIEELRQTVDTLSTELEIAVQAIAEARAAALGPAHFDPSVVHTP
ncbi:MAG: hypothetical protein OXR64_09860 [Chloroflexota bacterium]|nr:hypothetical protein [Chloroflexota bacterium]MDE2920137.1 hypothetical protein [Chloroflexota bacterium]